MSDRSPRIVVVGSDPRLRSEFEAALNGLNNLRVVTHFVPDFRQGIEAARSRRPDLLCVELDGDVRKLTLFAEEISGASPETLVAALYGREMLLRTEESDSIVIEAMRANVRDFLRRPLSSGELGQLLDRLDRRSSAKSRQLGTVIAFVSNKGGVGKSTLSTNAAVALAKRHPDRVLLIDASIQLGVCNFMLNLNPTTSLVDAVRESDRLDETLLRRLAAVHGTGLHLLSAPADAVEASEISEDAISRILQLAKRTYDFVVVDTFALLDGVVMSILDDTDLVFQVMQGTVPSVVGGYRFRQVLEGLDIPRERLRLVLNQNYPGFTGNLRSADVAERLRAPLDYVFPYTKRLLIAQNAGLPHILGASRWYGFGKVMAELVQEVESLRMSSIASEATDEAEPKEAKDAYDLRDELVAAEQADSKERRRRSYDDEGMGDDGAAA